MNEAVASANLSLGHLAGERWVFDQSVTDVFPDMLKRSIPQYEVMRQAVFDIGSRFVQSHTAIVDLGCARGDALEPFVETFGAANGYIAVDVSGPMIAAVRERFAEEIGAGQVCVLDLDLCTAYPTAPTSVTLCVLTLQFTPLEHRQRILRDAFINTVPGGALILVEKVLGSTAELGAMMVQIYHAYKAGKGYTAEEIERKRLSLEHVLVPMTARWNEELLHASGFNQVECFWRWFNFAGWVAVKS